MPPMLARFRQQGAMMHDWLCRAAAMQAPGEPLYLRAYAVLHTPWKPGLGKLLSSAEARKEALGKLTSTVAKARKEVADYGVARLLAEAASVVVVDSLLLHDDPSLTFADVVWRETPAQDVPPPTLRGAVVGLTPGHLLLVGIGSSVHPRTGEGVLAPLWTASYAPAQLAAANVRVVPSRVFGERQLWLQIGESEREIEFMLGASEFYDDNTEQARELMRRVMAARAP